MAEDIPEPEPAAIVPEGLDRAEELENIELLNPFRKSVSFTSDFVKLYKTCRLSFRKRIRCKKCVLPLKYQLLR